jgi:hypothetical protein
VIDTKHRAHSIDRYRVCEGCGHRFATMETCKGAPVKAGEAKAYRPISQAEVAPMLGDLPQPVIDDLLAWWNTARWNKWKGKAVWTARAFQTSVQRVLDLHQSHPQLAAELVREAADTGGWQALKAEYLGKRVEVERLRAVSAPGPRDPALQRAAERWRNAS